MTTVLVCTVGGNPAPVASAIRALRPARVVFLCTADIPELKQKGTEDQVPVILATAGVPDLPREIRIVPPDNPDAVFSIAHDALARLAGAEVVVDYTGGTKSMSAGLLQAALRRPGLRVQIMAGSRAGTDCVVDGTEQPYPLAFDAILAERALDDCERAWAAFAYDEAANILGRYTDPKAAAGLPAPLAARIALVEQLSRGFAAWDRFGHREALDLLEPLAADLPDLAARLPALRALAVEGARVIVKDGIKRSPPPETPAILLDLWLNAERRACGGRYDDAVARCYRLVEATAQWAYWNSPARIDTSAVEPDKVKAKTRKKLTANNELGLFAAWDCLGEELGRNHPLYLVMKRPDGTATARDAMYAWTKRRNYSILAHGFIAIAKGDWELIEGWMRRHLACYLEVATQRAGLPLRQLPTSLSGLDKIATPVPGEADMQEPGQILRDNSPAAVGNCGSGSQPIDPARRKEGGPLQPQT